MPYGIIFMSEVLPTIIFTAGGVAALWIGTSAFLRFRRAAAPEELARINESLEMLHESVEDLRDAMQDQMTHVREISGRVEFAERMLTRARNEERE